MKPWQASTSYFWEATPFFRLLLPLVVSIICYEYNYLPALSKLALAGVLTLSIIVSIVLHQARPSLYPLYGWRAAALHVTLFLGGWMMCIAGDIRHEPQWFGRRLHTATAFEVVAMTEPLEKERTWKLQVSVAKSWEQGQVIQTKGKAFIYLYKDSTASQIHEGDHLIIPNKWLAIKNAGNPYEFDHARFCHRAQIYHQQFLGKGKISVVHQAKRESSLVAATHHRAMRALEHHIPDTAALGLMQAMLLGDEINFDPELRQRYVETGIIHIVAISGSHVMIFFWIINLLFFWLKGKRYELVRYLVAVPLVCFYVAVAGAPTSAVRAAIMFGFLALGLALQKERQPLNQLFATAFFMLLYQPMWLFSVGFQLSFGAVLSLILFYPAIRKWYTPNSGIVTRLWEVIAASLAAEIIVAPLAIFYFHLLPAAFLLANVIAYLLMTFVLIAGLIIVLFSQLGWLAAAMATILTFLVSLFNRAMKMLQSFNPDSFKHLYLTLPELLLLYSIVCFAALSFFQRSTKALAACLLTTCILLGVLIIDKRSALTQQMFVVYHANRKAYAELISGNRYHPVANPDHIDPATDFATKELHMAQRAWRPGNALTSSVFELNSQRIIVLHQPLAIDTNFRFPADYLLIAYPARALDVKQLYHSFHFRKMIVAGNQKRYLVERWRDSCVKYHIPAHFTLFDGAFVLR